MGFSRFTVTAALPYANGPLHIGHMAGAYLPADIFVRHLRLNRIPTLFVCGSDEHGAAITLRAQQMGVSPKAIVDRYHSLNRNAFKEMEIAFDVYDRTSSEHHHENASDFFLHLLEVNALERGTSFQYYDTSQSVFLADRYIVGTCPKCSFTGAYGDQCERCGSALSPDDLIDPRSTLSGTTPEKRSTEHWYLPMQDHEIWLREWLEKGHFMGMQAPIAEMDPSKWKNNVLGQCLSWLNDGLRARAMTRDLNWGVPVPVDGADGKVLYVWLDAPIGYISATREWAKQQQCDWEPWWKSPDTALIHFIGKDNIVFHGIIFPILLKAHGGYILPQNVPANEFLNLEGQKISTSRNHAVWIHEYLANYPDKVDELRYVLCSIAPETSDSEFTWKEYQLKINSELVGILGNLIHRVLVLYFKFFDGRCASPPILSHPELRDLKARFRTTVHEHIMHYRFRAGLFDVMDAAREGNKFLTLHEPWKRFKDHPDEVRAVMDSMLVWIAELALLAQPFLPLTSKRIFHQLGFETDTIPYDEPMPWKTAHQLAEPSILFNKIEDSMIEQEMNKLHPAETLSSDNIATQKPNEIKPSIEFGDFSKIDIRAATILKAEKVPDTDKLMRLEIDLGIEQRTLISGIAQWYSAEELPGKKILVLANLSPKKMRGIVSHGMALLAENPDGTLRFVSPDDVTENGAGIA
jgi:methionyl-tRNA synthetase